MGKQVTLTENIAEVELEQFYNLCKNHDWTYEYSDDNRVYERGRKQRQTILGTLNSHKDDPRYERIYNYHKNKNAVL